MVRINNNLTKHQILMVINELQKIHNYLDKKEHESFNEYINDSSRIFSNWEYIGEKLYWKNVEINNENKNIIVGKNSLLKNIEYKG